MTHFKKMSRLKKIWWGVGVVLLWGCGMRAAEPDEGLALRVIAAHTAPYPLPAEQSLIFKTIAETHGVRFSFDWRQATDYTTQLAVLLASGKLPDLIGNPEAYGVAALVEEGAIIPLDDLIARYGPNISAAVGPERAADWRGLDGRIYTLPGIMNMQGAYAMMIRQDWLDKLGLDQPETWDQWVAVWRAFRDNDMNGDGDPSNEIPLAFAAYANGESIVAPLLWAFGIQCSADTQFCVYNGQYLPVAEHPRYAAFLRAAADLYREGLLDREFSSRSQTDLFTIMDNGLCGSTCTWAERAGVSTAVNQLSGDPTAFWQTLPPLAGPYGDQYIPARDWRVSSYAVTSAAEPKAAEIIAFFNWMYSDKGIELYSFGVEGQTFEYADGAPRLRPELLADGFASYRRAGLQYAPFPGVWTEEAYLQCLLQGRSSEELAPAARSFYDGLFTVNKDRYFTMPDTLATEAFIRYRAALITNGLAVLRARCIAGHISADAFAAQYQSLKARGFQRVIDQAAAAYALTHPLFF
jgi:ABC-type glycerol-3-phosphate transport system substrate-binding protein